MSPGRAVAAGGLLPRLLPNSLFIPEHPLRAILIGWPTALLPSMVLAALVAALLPAVEGPEFKADGLFTLFALVIFAPALETAIMATVLGLLLLLVPARVAVLLSAAGWGIAHSLVAPAWGLVIWWPFLVFSTLFVTWRERSLWLALLVPASVHALQNLIPALLLLYGF